MTTLLSVCCPTAAFLISFVIFDKIPRLKSAQIILIIGTAKLQIPGGGGVNSIGYKWPSDTRGGAFNSIGYKWPS